MLKHLIVAAGLCTALAPAYADSSATPRIDRREQNQAARIERGVDSGALTPREAGTLDAREAHIAADEAAAKADGHVSPAERAQLRGEERRTGRAIARKAHNARVAAPAAH